MHKDNLYQSFIIRCQRVGDNEQQGEWTSEAEHIQSGLRHTFSSVDELVAFLRRQLNELECNTPL